MATAATIPRTDTRSFGAWFVDFLKKELAPYPGRGAIVARMVISATITMILVMTFRIPSGAIGPLYAFMISRENLVSTAKSAWSVVIAFGIGAVFIPVGAAMFASTPLTHFLWQAFSIFLIFFAIRVLANYSIASGLGLMATSAIAVWYLPGPAELNLERTLWQVCSPAVGAAVTFGVEAVFHAFRHEDELLVALDTRLEAMQAMFREYANGTPVSRETEQKLAQYALTGVGALRRLLAHTNYEQLYSAQMTAVVSLAGRSIDFAAGMIQAYPEISAEDRQLAAKMELELADIRRYLKEGHKPPPVNRKATASHVSLLRELEEMIGLIPRVFEGATSLETYRAFSHVPEEKKQGFLVRDAFTNPEHVRYALAGCLAGMLCYVFYASLDWPGLSTSVTTCVLTALSNIGASRQKQLLRIAGALIGGFVFGLGAQIFVLPYLDSITGFTLLFVAVSTIAAWIATSSPRLSYCGLQIALAFYLIHVNDFTIQTSLAIARDRAIGVLLGIAMMWLVFDQLQQKTAANQMVGTFIKNLRLMADLAVIKLHPGDPVAIVTARKLRDRIYNNFSSVNAQADAVPFEIGQLRNQHMAARDRIRRWQAMLRTFYLLDLALLQYRAFGETANLPEKIQAALDHFEESCANTLREMAAYLEAENTDTQPGPVASIREPLVPPEMQEFSTALQRGSMPSLANELAAILGRMRGEMMSASLFAIE
ncbi:FUSC family protein [Edaphobacter albus]|uniref:FUSC family protein n=1 Tax=Edaphobacter sp. 4G125 TaxID=2763071 RepID=UPI0016493B1E|nr:FUSC family protein [Edaphobacter sp. 4G125]QNI36464.1 FUSC family protein [Edaphobacter sp. 4G125]